MLSRPVATLVALLLFGSAPARLAAQDAASPLAQGAGTPTEDLSAPSSPGGAPADGPSTAPSEPTATETAPSEEPASAPRPPLVYHLVIDIGFSHWLGNTFEAPAGIYTPALTIHGVPVDWLEIVLAYTGSVLEFTIPTAMRTSQIGFVELSLVLRKELRVGGDMLMLGCGPMVGLVYDVLGAGITFGAEIVGRYLVQLGNALAIGPFIDVRAALYDLPGDPRPFYQVVDGKVIQGHLDAQIQLGAAIAF